MIYIGADHRGFRLKEEINKWLDSQQYEYRDLGAKEYDKEDDFPEISIKLAEKVAIEAWLPIRSREYGLGCALRKNR
jgi:ribose 5-phosphate isomerase B